MPEYRLVKLKGEPISLPLLHIKDKVTTFHEAIVLLEIHRVYKGLLRAPFGSSASASERGTENSLCCHCDRREAISELLVYGLF